MTSFPLTTSPVEQTFTPDQLREIDRRTPERPSLTQLAGDAIHSEWASSWFARWAVDQTMPTDPDFALTPELLGELTEGLDPSVWGDFQRAESLTHALYIRNTMQEVQDSRERLARAGVTGAALQIGAAVIDPAFLAGGALLEIGTAGAGTPAVAAQAAGKASRVRSALRNGMLAIAADTPVQSFISSQDPEQGAREVLLAIAGGGLIGGGLGAVFPRMSNAEAAQAARMYRDLQAEELKTAAADAGINPMSERQRVLTEIKQVFGKKQADTIAPVLDAYAAGIARRGGDYYKGLRVERGGKPGDGALYSTVAWHGGPHKFDRFDISKIGTGEGAQAYGWGLYFSSRKGVAEWYREGLSGTPQITLRRPDGSSFVPNPDSPPARFRGETQAYVALQFNGGDIDKAIADLEAPSFSGNAGNRRRGAEVLRQWKNEGVTTEVQKPGALYNVELSPDADELLDWDKPLSQQSEKVQNALGKLDPDGEMFGGFHPNDTGEDLYNYLKYLEGGGVIDGPRRASMALREAGIPGIRYLDGSSRGAGDGTHNFVIFDDADVAIKEMFQRGAGGTAQGSFEVAQSGQRVIRALTNPDASTLPHEVAHDFMHNLPVMDADLAERAAKAVGAKSHAEMTVAHQEKFARGFESYLRTGKAPSPALKEAFDTFRQWLVDIYRTVKGSPLERKMNKDLRAVFDEMLTKGDVADDTADIISAMGSAGAGSFRRPMDKLTDILSDKGRAYFRDQTDPAVQRERVDTLIDSVFDEETADMAAGLKALEPDEAMATLDQFQRATYEPDARDTRTKLFPSGARDEEGNALPPDRGTVAADDFDASFAQDGADRIERPLDPPVGGSRRLSDRLRLPTFNVRLGSAKDSATRVFGRASIKENLLRRGDDPIGLSAEEWSKQKRRGTLALYGRQTGRAHANFNAKREPGSRLTRKQFNELVTQSLRSVETDADPDIAAAVRSVRQIRDHMLEMFKRHRVDGFEEVEADPFKITRVWNTAAIHAADREYGTEAVNALIRRAIAAETPDLTDQQLEKLATGFAESVRTLNTWSARAKAAMLSGDDADELAAMLRGWGMPESDIEQVLYRVSPRDDDAGKINRAKHRLRLDENATLDVDGRTLSLQQLLENDMDAIMESYVREGYGAMAAREVYRAVSMHIDPDGGLDIKTWDQLSEILGKRLDEAGHTDEQIKHTLSVAEMTDRWVKGLPIRDHAHGRRFFDRVRQYGFLAYSGGFGATQQIEWGNLLGEAGVRAAMVQMPALRAAFRKAADGTIDNAWLARVESMTGLATDSINSRYLDHFDYKTLEHPTAHTADRRMHAIGRGASYANGMIPTLVLQKRASIMLATQKWLDIAKSGKIPGKQRLATMGLSEGDARAVAEGVRRHAKTTRTAFGTRMDELDLDSWLARDPATATKYLNALDAWSTRVVQEGDLGSMMPWTTAPWGMVVTQFKSFVLNAWEKQFLHRAQVHDFPAFVGAAWTFMLSGLVYAARAHMQSIGREDREEYLRDRMSPANIAAGAARYAGWASFMPDVLDTFLPARYQVFNRNSGLSSDVFDIGMAPVPSLFGNAAKAAGAVATLPLDGEFTQREWRAINKLLPFQTYFGFRNLLDAVGTRLPEDER